MLCAVHLIDDATENVALDKHAKGYCLLEEVCRRKKLTPEMDYFGLRFLNKSGDEHWLNLRNQIRSQMNKSQIYHFYFRVKYFVKQSQLFLGETKHQFFLNVKQNISQGKYFLSGEKCSRFIVLSLRSDHGEEALDEIIRDWSHVDIGYLEKLRSEDLQLRGVCGIKAREKLLSELENEEQTYGAEMFNATNYLKERIIIAVGIDALRIYDNEHGLIDEYKYSKGLYPSVKSSNFIVEIEESYHCYKITYTLDNAKTAKALYRTTVEFCTFFVQEKVYDWVLDSKKTINYLKTVVSILKHKRKSAEKEKVYDFDILRTAPEAFNRAWKLLAEEKARSIQIACGLHTPKICRQKTFKFGPDTPKSCHSNNVFDFSQLRARSGYSTPIFMQMEGDAPASPKTPGLPLSPKTPMVHTPFMAQTSVNRTPPTRTLTPATRTHTPPTRTLTPPTRTHTPPTRTHTPPTRTHTPPTRTHTPPTRTHTPPTRTHTPPTRTHTPPTTNHTPPMTNHTPPTRTHTPPTRTHTPPTRTHTPPTTNHTPPRTNHTPPTTNHTPPTTNHTPPTTNHTPPMTNHTPPTTNHTPPTTKTPSIPPIPVTSLKSFPSEAKLFITPSSDSEVELSFQDIISQLKATSSAEKEVMAFRARFLCHLCKKAYRNCSFVPCGHVIACFNCASKSEKCGECQVNVERTIRIRYP